MSPCASSRWCPASQRDAPIQAWKEGGGEGRGRGPRVMTAIKYDVPRAVSLPCPALASPDSRGSLEPSSERGEKREGGGSACPLFAFSPPIVPIVSHEFSSSPLLLLFNPTLTLFFKFFSLFLFQVSVLLPSSPLRVTIAKFIVEFLSWNTCRSIKRETSLRRV